MVEIVSFVLFLASAVGIGFMISKKVPLLLAVPEQFINESFVTRPPHIKRIEHIIRKRLERKRYEAALFLFLEKTLRRTHILLLKSDALVSRLLMRIQNRNHTVQPREAQYWQTLRTWKEEDKAKDIPEVNRPTPVSLRKFDGIRKIFSKKNGEMS